MPKYRLEVMCLFEIEVENDNEALAIENTVLTPIEELLSLQTNKHNDRTYAKSIKEIV